MEKVYLIKCYDDYHADIKYALKDRDQADNVCAHLKNEKNQNFYVDEQKIITINDYYKLQYEKEEEERKELIEFERNNERQLIKKIKDNEMKLAEIRNRINKLM